MSLEITFLDKREECYDMCDGKKKPTIRMSTKKKKDEDKKIGGWVWTKSPEEKINI